MDGRRIRIARRTIVFGALIVLVASLVVQLGHDSATAGGALTFSIVCPTDPVQVGSEVTCSATIHNGTVESLTEVESGVFIPFGCQGCPTVPDAFGIVSSDPPWTFSGASWFAQWDPLGSGTLAPDEMAVLNVTLDNHRATADWESFMLCGGVRSAEFPDNATDCSETLHAPSDFDRDGCDDHLETQAISGAEVFGGLRNAKNFWDFFDTPDASNIRDKAVAGTDFFAVLSRFGATGDPGIDPLSMPPPAPVYHTAFDRGPSGGPNPWNLTAADGAITGQDFFAVLTQFGHSCG
jgi:hypothetical protein